MTPMTKKGKGLAATNTSMTLSMGKRCLMRQSQGQLIKKVYLESKYHSNNNYLEPQ